MADWFWTVISAAELDMEIRNVFALDNMGRGDEIHGVAHVTYSDESVKRATLIRALEGRGVAFDWQKKQSQTLELSKNMLVTVGGECFGIERGPIGNPDDRDGILYYFKLQDLAKDRGRRSVSLFLSGSDNVAIIKDYNLRVDTVTRNVIRRAFDSGDFGFETSIPPDRYHELRLTAADFQPQQKANDDVIRRFMKFSGYYVGFKHRTSPLMIVDFDCAED